jgi:hypothetical protein
MVNRTGQINYVMQPNSVVAPSGGQRYSPVIQYDRNRDTDYLIAAIAQRTAVSATTVKMVISALTEVIPQELSEGNIVTLNDLASFRPTLRGITTDPNYVVTVDNARLFIRARAAERLRLATEKRVTYQRLPYEERVPVIESFLDLVTQTSDHLTAGNAAVIRGSDLKPISTEPPQVGLFIIDATTETKVTTVLKSTERTFEFMIPERTGGGDYTAPIQLERRVVYTQRQDGSFGSLRTGTYILG